MQEKKGKDKNENWNIEGHWLKYLISSVRDIKCLVYENNSMKSFVAVIILESMSDILEGASITWILI